MKRITVTASRSYDIVIGSNLHTSIGTYLADLSSASSVAIISDSNVWPIYGSSVKTSLENSGYRVVNYVFQAGEENKNAKTYLSILDFLAQQHITRTDVLVALGGGVVGDITGFVAATYLRGIPYVQVPTTLLAMVDSSVGGKTAIDLPAGKNLVGAFYQPSLVLCDINALQTLPDNIFQDGCAEVIKYGILYDPDLFAHLSQNGIRFDLEYVIARCVALKRDVVAADELEHSERKLLNLGHTIAHGIEAGSNYTISHGKAVAIGIAIISRCAAEHKICDVDTRVAIREILSKFRLPTDTDIALDTIVSIALSDKKRHGDHIDLILPKQIGSCVIHPVAIDRLKGFLGKGL